MNDTEKIDKLTRDVKDLQLRLNVVTVILAIFVILSLISFLEIITNPGLLILFVLIFVIAILVAILIFLDIQKHGDNK